MTTPVSQRRSLSRALTSGVPLVLAAVVALSTAPPAQAAPGRCTPGTGVTVVVDFGSLGGGVKLGCDRSGAGAQASRVVPRAGFPLSYVAGQPFVCRINGLPSASDEACRTTPPEDAYWALYWSDGRNGRWVYSSSGVASLDVPAGGSIGFRWQNSDARVTPGAAPTAGAPPEPEPTKGPKPTPRPTPAPVTPTQPAGSAQPSSPDGTPTAPGPIAPERASKRSAQRAQQPSADERAEQRAEQRTEQRAERRAAAKAERRAEREVAAEDEQVTSDAVAQEETPMASTSATDDGSGALTWAAGGAVLLLAAAAGVLALRRRG